ncbi:MAG: hypothetical protein RI894_1425 [Bacteroidota bacterium]|jgi:uncharacterized protein (TIGR02646 family)
MKYIQKQPTPAFFIADTAGLTLWNEYLASKKRYLKTFILANEQFGLCCYCEQSITAEQVSSHIEHVKPKSLDIANLTFDYSNLLVSCEGNHFNEIGDTTKNTCGHLKDDNFDEIKFLNPALLPDISDYFIFDKDEGFIFASAKDTEKANYTAYILNLNGKNNKLAEARKIAKNAFIRNLNASNMPFEQKKAKIIEFLYDDSKEFISFFRYFFKAI